MNQSVDILGLEQAPVSVELLGDDELAGINGGLAPWVVGLALAGGALGIAAAGIMVGMAFYYISRE